MATSLSEDGLPQWKRDFLKACTDYSALSFGTFTLKSGRISPYFFNAGIFHRASAFRILTGSFAHAIASHEPVLNFDVVFGPAYKGIPLAAAVIDKLAQLDEKRFGDVSYSFNRKEVKTHGDGGSLVGSPLAGKRILIVDDVITAGTAIREAIEIIRANGGTLAGIVVALDRMEKMPTATDDDGEPGPSTIGAVRKEYGIPVVACLTLDDIIEGFKSIGNGDDVKRMEEYRSKYRAVD